MLGVARLLPKKMKTDPCSVGIDLSQGQAASLGIGISVVS